MHIDLFRYLQARLNIQSERGAALVEYALLLALIAVICIAAVRTIGTKTNTAFDSIGTAIP